MRILLWLGIALALPVQATSPFAFGVKGGVSIGPSDRTIPIGDRGGSGERRDFIRRYVVGPAALIDIPFWNLRFEAGVFYRRFSREESRFLGRFGGISRFSGNTWEFPFLFEKRLPFGAFAGGGASFRHIWLLTVEREMFNGGFEPDRVLERTAVDLGDANQGGWVLTGGLERGVRRLCWSVELRYTRWTSLSFQPSRNQTDLLIGFRF